MTGAGSGEGEGRREDAFHGPAGVQRGSGNLQVNFHEHRAGIVSACTVALVCVVTLIIVRVGGGGAPGTGATGSPANTATTTAPAPAPAPPGTAGPVPAVLTGQLVNGNSGLCLRAPGTGDGLVPVEDTCTRPPHRTRSPGPGAGGVTPTGRRGPRSPGRVA
ncbi:hypothetical protein ACFV7Q_35860, partial [Streptomyces sp. NPDC059851]